jgi:hypothetical protein
MANEPRRYRRSIPPRRDYDGVFPVAKVVAHGLSTVFGHRGAALEFAAFVRSRHPEWKVLIKPVDGSAWS